MVKINEYMLILNLLEGANNNTHLLKNIKTMAKRV